MTTPVVIQGFPSSNRVPGPYGEVLTGQGGQSAASLPMTCLVVGLPTSGSLVPDTQIAPILSTADADNFAGPGSEGACMLYDALAAAGNAGVPLWYTSAKPAGGATAATVPVRFSGTATGAGQVTVRINGTPVSQGIAIGDTAAQVATNLSLTIAGFKGGRLPLTATASTVYCNIACRTNGIRGMQHVVFLDTTQLPAGITATLYRTWATVTTYAIGDVVIPKATPNGLYFEATAITTGISGASEPTWPTTVGTTVVDTGVTWTCWGSTATGSVPTTAVFLGNSTGTETYTNLLVTLANKSYDRIALAANDAASLAAWKFQVDQYMLAPFNFLQHVVVATNGSFASAQSLYQTTLNDTSFCGMWMLNGESHPSRMAAVFAAIRASVEPTSPNPNYDGLPLPGIAPQSQIADYPSVATLISAINNSVTPVDSRYGDGLARIERAITTKSLTSGSADYSTLDIGQRVVPDFVLKDGKLYWSSTIQPGNPACQDDPPKGQRQPVSGIMTPSRIQAAYNAKLVDYSQGILLGTSASTTPIVIAPLPGDVQGSWDPVAQRIMLSETVRVMPLNHQIGISIRQATP